MKDRLKYIFLFPVFLCTEIMIAKHGEGAVRGYLGDILVIPTVYFLLRIFFAKDGTFSVYVLPMLCYCLGWIAEVLQAVKINDILGIDKDSPLGIILGSVYDIKDGLCYFLGLMLIGLYLAVESNWKTDRRWWYPIGVFLHLTWGSMQTMVGFFIYLVNIKCPHEYYGGVVKTAWHANSGLSMGLFIFTPWEPGMEENGKEDPNPEGRLNYCSKVIVHEYGHTFQALLLGPLYPIIIGIPSICWGSLPACAKMRQEKNLKYTWMFCEKWASYWGEKVTKKEAVWD